MNKNKPDKSNFFIIDSSKKFSAEGVVKFPFVAIIPLALFLAFLIAGVFLIGNFNDADGILAIIIILFALSAICLSATTATIIIKRREWFRLKNVLNYGWATVGKVEFFSCEKYTKSDSDGGSYTEYVWDLTYSYLSIEGQYFEKRINGRAKSAPAFLMNQKLIIAYYKDESFIITKFTIKRGELKETEFNGENLSGELVKHNCSIFPYRFWLYIFVSVIFSGAFLFAAVTLFQNTGSGTDIFGVIIFGLISIPFLVAFIFQIIKLFKRIIMLKTGLIVLGKIVAPEFYSGKDMLYYYYKDNAEHICRGNITNPPPYQKDGSNVFVGYNKKGKSIAF